MPYEGYVLGFLISAADLLSFILSFLLALKLYSILGKALVAHFQLTPGFGNAIAFFIIAFISEILLNLLFRRLIVYIPPLPETNKVVR